MKNILLVLPLLLIFSCSVQKRKYQKGYYVDWHQGAGSSKEKKAPLVKGSEKKEIVAQEITLPSIADPEMIVSVHDNIGKSVFKKKKMPLIGDEPCDDIIFKDGSEIKGKIVEVTPTEIKYKKCDLLDGPNYVAKKSEVFMIKYANGTREVFKDQSNISGAQNQSARPNQNQQRELNNNAIISLTMAILSLILFFIPLVFSIIAITKGERALREIHAQPNLYKGEVMATVGKIIGIIITVLWLLLILLIILAAM